MFKTTNILYVTKTKREVTKHKMQLICSTKVSLYVNHHNSHAHKCTHPILTWVSKFHCCKQKNRLLHLQLHKQPFPLRHYFEISNFPNVASASQILGMITQTHTARIGRKNCCNHFTGNFCIIHSIVCTTEATLQMSATLQLIMKWHWLSVDGRQCTSPTYTSTEFLNSRTSGQIYHSAWGVCCKIMIC
jgi:hypothetical protein